MRGPQVQPSSTNCHILDITLGLLEIDEFDIHKQTPHGLYWNGVFAPGVLLIAPNKTIGLLVQDWR